MHTFDRRDPRFGSVYLILYKNFLLTLMAEVSLHKKARTTPIARALRV